MSMKMRYKIIVIGVFVYCILNFPVFNKFTKIIPVPDGGPGLYAQDVDVVKLKKEEEERKKKTKKSKYVVTNENLDKIELPKKPYGFIKLGKKETDKAAGSAGGENGSQVETEIPVETNNSTGIGDVSSADQSTKEYWQEQVRNIYAEIDRTEADIKKNQWELNNLNNQLQAEDIYEKRMQMLKKMDALRKSIPELEQKLIDLNQEMEDLEDRARKQGILPGWLRVERPEPMQDQEPKKNQNNSTEKG